MNRALLLLLPLAMGLLSACTAPLPPELNAPGVEPLSLTQVLAAPERYRGRRVRWGGRILEVENRAEESWVQILARPLDRSGQPGSGGPEGRFLAHSGRFIDPAVYVRGRYLTVVGTLRGGARRRVGERTLILPVVEIEALKLWSERERHDIVYPPPYWWYYPPYWPAYYYYWW